MRMSRYKGILYPSEAKDTTKAWRPTNLKHLRQTRATAMNVHRGANKYSLSTRRTAVRNFRKEKIEARMQLKQDRGRKRR